jgi:two-component system, chemotaxis family, protein-glutamate methylesterase/glutaminase
VIRVLIVDDSALSRAILKVILEADGDIQVVGEATSGREAVPRIQELSPDIVTMDVDMPGQNGLETIEQVMQTAPVPIVLVTGERLGPESDIGFRAIQLGALDFMAKPPITDAASTAVLRAQVRTLSRVPVFVHDGEKPPESLMLDAPLAVPISKRRTYKVVAIASGTGGPKALAAIAGALTEDFACPILVVQHLPDRFTSAFAKYLQSLTPLRVVLVDAMPHECRPGEIILSKGSDAHIFCPRAGAVVGMDAPPYADQRPSATVLLRSVAETYGKDAIGVVLSGTGDDGLEGIAAMHGAGALTLAESPASALVPDLPQLAVDAKTVSRTMPAEMLADFLVATVSNASSKTTAPPSKLD